jgi:drug/metabolite transporter (DMT)-like permease
MSLASAPNTGHAGNITGMLAMIVSMAASVSNDLCVKLASERVPLGELIALRNTIATIYVAVFIAACGGLRWLKDAPARLLSVRILSEICATVLFVAGLIALPIADATVLGQTAPIVITAGAAVFLRERVRWPLWIAIAIGLMGVLLVVRPGTEAFSPAAFLILGSVMFVALRDLATRRVSAEISTAALTLMSTASGIVGGLLILPYQTLVWPAAHELGLLLVSGFLLTLGFAFTIIAMRNGEVAFVSPFRYTIILFALVYGWVGWGQFPDAIQIAGIVTLTIAGIFALHYERTRVIEATFVSRPTPRPEG